MKMNWNNISLFKFQQIEAVNKSNIPEMDKVLFTAQTLVGLTEYEFDKKPIKKVNRIIAEVEDLFKQPLIPVHKERFGKYKINYDPGALVFGQYTDLSFFLQSPAVKSAHYVLATLAGSDAETHRDRAEYFLKIPVGEAIGSALFFAEKFRAFNQEYKSLFGLDPDVNGSRANEDQFNKRYGWIYSATKIADYEKITLESAFALPVRRALNALAYLKAQAKYESDLYKERKNHSA